MMSDTLTSKARVLLLELTKASFPQLGKEIGDFVLYDSLVAGALDCAAHGRKWTIPVPDSESWKFAERLQRRKELSSQEESFLEYWRLLERIRDLLETKDNE